MVFKIGWFGRRVIYVFSTLLWGVVCLSFFRRCSYLITDCHGRMWCYAVCEFKVLPFFLVRFLIMEMHA